VSLVIAVPLALAGRGPTQSPGRPYRAPFHNDHFCDAGLLTALLLVLVFSIRLKIFPTSGLGDAFIEYVFSLTLPSLTIGFTSRCCCEACGRFVEPSPQNSSRLPGTRPE
jgi:hypothetical protein